MYIVYFTSGLKIKINDETFNFLNSNPETDFRSYSHGKNDRIFLVINRLKIEFIVDEKIEKDFLVKEHSYFPQTFTLTDEGMVSTTNFAPPTTNNN